MRSIRPLRTAALGAALAAIAVAAPATQTEPDRVLKDKDLKKLSSELAEWFEALDAGKGKMEAEEAVRKELDKINDKKLKGGDLLASPLDLGSLIYLANRYEKKMPKRANGKVTTQTVDSGGRGDVEFAVWTPPKYRPKDGPYQVILTIPEEGENPEKHIQDRWVDNGLRDATVIASPKMPGDSKQWTEVDGLGAVLLTLRGVSETYAIDFDRVFIGGRGRGGEAALAIANMFPSRFAGAFCWAGDGGEGIPADNLKHLPVFISGGGSNATAFAERAKEAGVESVTIEPSGGEAEIIAWMGDMRRVKYPDEFTLVPGPMFPTNAYWLQIPRLPDINGVRVDVRVDRETNTITIDGTGLTEATIYLSDAIVDLDKPVTVVANGKTYVDQFERSFRTFLDFLSAGKVDPGRVFVASKQYHLPSKEG